MNTPDVSPALLDRREAIKWMLAGAGAMALHDAALIAAESSKVSGYGLDPDLLREYKPGDLWPLTFTPAQRRAASALCEIIIPAEPTSPSAAKLGVHDFIDEWISAPYPVQQRDQKLILDGLAWIDEESRQRFHAEFAALRESDKITLCDELCAETGENAAQSLGKNFFKKFRDLTASGYYTTPEGMRDLGYGGNIPLAAFEGPPPEVLAKLGLI